MGSRWRAVALLLAPAVVWTASAASVAAEDLAWRRIALPGVQTTALAATENGRVLYLGSELGLHVSEDGGETWLYAGSDLEQVGAPPVRAIALHPRDPRIAFAGTEQGPSAGIYYTDDLGQHWRLVFAGRRQDGIRVLAISPDAPERVYAVAMAHDGNDDELVASEDGGRTWQVRLPDGSWHAVKYYALAVPRGGADLIYAASSQGVLVGRDGGRRWENVSDPKVPAYGLALAPDGGGLYVTGQREILLGRDLGATWRRVAGPALSVCQLHGHNGLVIGPAQAPVLYAATRSLCQQESATVLALPLVRGQREWIDVGGGLPPAMEVRLVLVGGEQPRLYALGPDGLWVADLTVGPAGGAAGEGKPSEAAAHLPEAGQTAAGGEVGVVAPGGRAAAGEGTEGLLWAVPLGIAGLAAGRFAWRRWRAARNPAPPKGSPR